MYSDFPSSDQRRIRATYALMWSIIGASGVTHVLSPGESIDAVIGHVVLAVGGVALAVAAILGVIGVLINRYRLEWGAAALATIGAIPYVLSTWWVLATEGFGPSRTVVGTLLLLYPISRSIACLAHSNRVRMARRVAELPQVSGAIATILSQRGDRNE